MNKSYLNDKNIYIEALSFNNKVFIKSIEKLIKSLDYLKSENKINIIFLMIAQQKLNLK